MPFNSVITNQTARRASGYNVRQFIMACPNTSVFRCQASADSTASSYAEFAYTNVTIGAFGDVKEGQTVIISSDTAMRNILFRGRVRKVPTASIFYINQTSFALKTSYYITVINTYDLVERLERIDATGNVFKDFDLTYQNLPPCITNLQSSYILPTTSATASQAFAPTAQAMASGATISSWLWDVADGTITVGTSTSQNITVSFPTGHRWVRLFVTDSNGVQTRFVFEVWVGNVDAVSDGNLLRATEGASITATWEDGWNASIEWFDGLSNLLDGTRITIFSLHSYADGTSQTTVDFVGYLQNDNVTLAGDENYGQVKTASLQALGFGALLGRLKAPSALANRSASPSNWGDIAAPTPARVLTYALAWHTTAFNLCSFQWQINDTIFELDDRKFSSDDVSLEQYQALEIMDDFLSRYNAEPTFSPSGEIRGTRNACYLSSTERNNLTTVCTLTPTDFLSMSMDTSYYISVGSIIMPAITFNTTTLVTNGYTAKAPAITALYSGEEQTAPRQVLMADSTDSQARQELGGRAANYLAYINRRVTMTLELIDSYSDLVPSNDRWFVLSLPAADNSRGRAYTTERWLLSEISVDAVSPDGVRTVSATFLLETSDVGAQILVTRIPPPAELNHPLVPISPPFADLDNPWLSPDSDPVDYPFGGYDDLRPKQRDNADAGCELLNVPMWVGDDVLTSFSTVLGKTYTIYVKGQAAKTTPLWTATWDFKTTDGAWTANSAANRTPNLPLYVAGTGWQSQQMVNNSVPTDIAAYVDIRETVSRTLTSYTLTFDLTKGTIDSSFDGFATSALWSPPYTTPGNAPIAGTLGRLVPDGINQQITWSGSQAVTDVSIILWANLNLAGISAGQVTLTGATLEGEGTLPAFTGATTSTNASGVILDAFYSTNASTGAASLLSSSLGLRINGAVPTSISEYSPTGEYVVQVTGTGLPLVFFYAQASYTGTPRVPLIVQVCPREPS